MTQSESDSVFEALAQADAIAQPFCSCGRVVSQCDGSRRKCVRNQKIELPESVRAELGERP